MAEDIRGHDTIGGDVEELRASLKTECTNQSNNTLYTSTSFYIWLRHLRQWRAGLWILAVIASTLAASSAVKDFGIPPVWVAGLTLAGVLLPGIVKALKIEESIEQYAKQAAHFKIAEGELRRASEVWSNKEIDEFEKEARVALNSLDEARLTSLTPPEWCFRSAQRKIKKGDYEAD